MDDVPDFVPFRYLTPDEVADRLGVDVSVLHRVVTQDLDRPSNPQGPPVARMGWGRTWMVREDVFARWLEWG